METLKLDSLELKNFGIYKDTELDFRGKDIVGVLAEYHNAKERSNRAGKSLIIEAVRYNLTGLLRYKKAAQMIHKGEKVMSVKAIYSDSNGKTYVINRGVNHKGEGLLQLDWMEKSRESQEGINNLFGISREDFDLTLFFKQADINGFMNLGASKKTEHLMKWLDNEHWKIKEARVKEDVKDLKIKLRDNETTIKALSESMETVEDLDAEIELLETQKSKANLDVENHVLRKEKITKKISDIRAKKSTAKEMITKIDKELGSIENAKRLQVKYGKVVTDNKAKIVKLEKTLPKEVKNMGELEIGIEQLKDEVNDIKKYVDISKKHKGGMCPLLNSHCDRITVSKKDMIKMNNDLISFNKEIEKIETQFEQQEKRETILSIISGCEDTIQNAINILDETKIKDFSETLLKEKSKYVKAYKNGVPDLRSHSPILNFSVVKIFLIVRGGDILHVSKLS